MNHSGNVRYRQLVQSNTIGYSTCINGRERNAVAAIIISDIRNAGGRFLEKNEETGKYYDIGDNLAIRRAKQAMRDHRASMSKLFVEDIDEDVLCNKNTPKKKTRFLPDILPENQEERLLNEDNLEDAPYQEQMTIVPPRIDSPIFFGERDEERLTNNRSPKRYKCGEQGLSFGGYDKQSMFSYLNEHIHERGDEISDRREMFLQFKSARKDKCSNKTSMRIEKSNDSIDLYDSIGSFPCEMIENADTVLDQHSLEPIDLAINQSNQSVMTFCKLDKECVLSFDLEPIGVPEEYE